MIRREFPKDRCPIAKIIGGALGRQKMLTSDVLIAKRIAYFIETGALSVVEGGGGRFYSAVVACTGKQGGKQ